MIVKECLNVILEIEFEKLESGFDSIYDEVRKRGVLVVCGVVLESEVRGYKSEFEEYIRKNLFIRGM